MLEVMKESFLVILQRETYRSYKNKLEKIIESANVEVDEENQRQDRTCKHDLDDQDENTN